MAFNHKHLIDITEYSDTDLMTILETAKAFSQVNERAIKKVPTLKGKTIVNMFNEPSTRTRSSFELAEKRLSADTLNFGGLLGYGPVMRLNTASPADFIHRGGRIPAPIQSLKN